jgi:hypothetical protein
VWLANTLLDLPDVKKIYLLIRRQKSNPAERRFEKMVEDSPVFDPLFERHGDRLPEFLREKIEVIEGDVTQPGLGLAAETRAALQKNLDLIINSSGLTDFNPDLRDALAPIRWRRQHSRVRSDGRSCGACCIFRRATWLASRMGESAKNLRRTTIRAGSRTSTPSRNGESAARIG